MIKWSYDNILLYMINFDWTRKDSDCQRFWIRAADTYINQVVISSGFQVPRQSLPRLGRSPSIANSVMTAGARGMASLRRRRRLPLPGPVVDCGETVPERVHSACAQV